MNERLVTHGLLVGLADWVHHCVGVQQVSFGSQLVQGPSHSIHALHNVSLSMVTCAIQASSLHMASAVNLDVCLVLPQGPSDGNRVASVLHRKEAWGPLTSCI